MKEPEILEETVIHKRWINLISRKIKHPNGGVQEYEIVNPDAHSVAVLALTKDEKILLVELFRFGQNQRHKDLPAGGVGKGEDFEDAIKRELLEETGYQGEIEKVGTHVIAAEHGVTRHVFVAKNCVKVGEPQYEQSEIDEGAKLEIVDMETFIEVVRSGQMTETASAYMALDHLGILSTQS